MNPSPNIRPRPRQRPVVAIPAGLRKAATRWAGAYLPGQDTSELQRALAVLKTHPEQAARGYSDAKAARQRVELELNRRAAL